MNFQYKITEKDFLSAFKLHMKYGQTNWFDKTNRIIGFSLGALITIFAIQYPDKKLVITVIVILIILLICLHNIGQQRVKSEYANNAFIKQLVDFTLKSEGCLLVSDDFHILLRWKKIHQYVENDSYWLLYASPQLIYIVPKLLVSKGESKQFSNILKQHIGKRGKVDSTMEMTKSAGDDEQWM